MEKTWTFAILVLCIIVSLSEGKYIFDNFSVRKEILSPGAVSFFVPVVEDITRAVISYTVKFIKRPFGEFDKFHTSVMTTSAIFCLSYDLLNELFMHQPFVSPAP